MTDVVAATPDEMATKPVPPADRTVAFALGATVITWGSAFAFIRITLRAYGPGEMALLRLAFASVALGIVTLFRGITIPRAGDWPRIAVLGFLGFGFYHAALNFGEVTVQAGVASLLIAMVPIFTAILAVVFLHERMGLRRWLGVLVAFAGVVLIIAGQQGSFGISTGALLILGCSLAAAAYNVIQQSLLKRYSALHLTTWAIWIGTITLMIFAGKLPRQMRAASWQMTAAVAYLGVFPAAAGYVMWNYALSKLPVSRVASFTYLVPVVATGLGFFILSELPTRLSLCGVPIAISGVYLVNRRNRATSNVEISKATFEDVDKSPTSL